MDVGLNSMGNIFALHKLRKKKLRKETYIRERERAWRELHPDYVDGVDDKRVRREQFVQDYFDRIPIHTFKQPLQF